MDDEYIFDETSLCVICKKFYRLAIVILFEYINLRTQYRSISASSKYLKISRSTATLSDKWRNRLSMEWKELVSWTDGSICLVFLDRTTSRRDILFLRRKKKG